MTKNSEYSIIMTYRSRAKVLIIIRATDGQARYGLKIDVIDTFDSTSFFF